MFNNQYRIPSARLQSWDYANEGMYFVTICTKNRECYFGEIVEAQCLASPFERLASLQPTEIGKVAENEWYKTVELRRDMNLKLGEFMVMPNHVHGIIMIGENKYNAQRDVGCGGKGRDAMYSGQDATHRVSTVAGYKNQFAPQSKNLASIIRGYKSAVTTYARKNNIEFDWQPRFHEHIIRSMDDYTKIADYIINNPIKWQNDKFFRSAQL